MQRVWKQKLSWDEPLPADLKFECGKSLYELKNAHNLIFPRRVIFDNNTSIVFTDASQKAYGTAAYNYSRFSSHLICSKARVAPWKRILSIPKLELMGILLGSRLFSYLVKMFDFKEIRLFLDSLVALSWVTNITRGLKDVFVSNRVLETRDL